MTINISIPDVGSNLHPQITVLGVGGSGSNAVNNMINSNLEGVDFAIANTDAQSLQISNCKKKIQLGIQSTRGLGAGMRPDVGMQAAEESLTEIGEMLNGSHMLFIAAGMGGGTGTGAAPVIAKLAREKGILTVGVVTKPFHFEGSQRMKLADKGLEELQQYVDTLLTIPNQNLFRIANENTTFADAFKMADDVLYAGVRGVTDLMVQPGLINLDFSDVKTVMSEMGKAMMGTGEASGEGRAIAAAEAAIANPLIDDVSLKGAKGLIINITGGNDITLYEVDEAANRIKQEVDENANIIYGTTCDERLEGLVRVSIVATGIDANTANTAKPLESFTNLSIDNSVYLNKNSAILNSDNHFQKIENQNILNKEDEIKSENILSNSDNVEISKIDFSPDDVPSVILEDESNLDDQSKEELDDIIINNLENEIESEDTNHEIKNHEDVKTDIDSSLHSNIDLSESPEPSVRRLSLFDTLEDTKPNKEESAHLRSEPTFEENEVINNIDNNDIEEQEFSAEELDIEKDFNQESDEELLDIPTFLRRQAN